MGADDLLNLRRRHLFLTTILLLLSLLTSGCWSRREIETLGFVMAIGIDKAQEDGKIQITAVIAKPFAIGGGDKGVPQESPAWIVSSTGLTAFDAVRNFASQSPRRFFFAHNRWIVFGEEFAKDGIVPALDLWSRNGETRRTAYVAVAKGATASDMLQTQFELERMPSEGARGTLLDAERALSSVVVISLSEFVQSLESAGSSAVAGRVEMVPRPQEFDIRGEVVREKVGASARFSGAAVFSGDRLVGWLDKSETRGMSWIHSKIKSGVIVIDNPQTPDSYVSIRISRARSQNKIAVENGRAVAHIKVEAEGDLGDTTNLIEPLQDRDLWSSMESRMAEVIRQEIRTAVSRGQELQTDYLGFGTMLYRSNPKLWEQLKDDWQDNVFPEMELEIDVRATIRRMGLVTRSDKVTVK